MSRKMKDSLCELLESAKNPADETMRQLFELLSKMLREVKAAERKRHEVSAGDFVSITLRYGACMRVRRCPFCGDVPRLEQLTCKPPHEDIPEFCVVCECGVRGSIAVSECAACGSWNEMRRKGDISAD